MLKLARPGKLDPLEPFKISSAIKKLNLKHAVITSVDRDDLDDGGANHFYEVILEIKKIIQNNYRGFNSRFFKKRRILQKSY